MIICPICNNKIEAVNYKNTYTSSASLIEYKLYECCDCGLEFWSPLMMMPEYCEKEHCAAYEEFHLGVRTLPKWCKPFFEKFPLKRGRLLDVGCGDGVFLKKAEENGFEVWGIDFDKKSVMVAQSKYQLRNVYHMSLEEFVIFACENKIYFDVITFFEVLQLQDKPLDFINNVRKILKNGGSIAGSVPNSERLFAASDRKLFWTDFPPHHFLWISKKTLERICSKNGFECLKYYSSKTDVMELSALIESISLGKFSSRIKKEILRLFFRQHLTNEKGFQRRIEVYEEIYGKGNKLFFLKFLRILRNIIFLLPALLIFYEYNRRGSEIYFEAKYRTF